MTLDKQVIRAKLARLNDYIVRVEKKRPDPPELLLTDIDAQDIVSHNLEKAVQICIDIASHICAANGRAPQSAGESFTTLSRLGLIGEDLAAKLVSAVGFRNISVHEYAEVDWTIVIAVATSGIEDLRAFGRWAAALAIEAG
jgi:uncharacterized protein YutE (UPF0331/DUF86 family)